MKRKTLSQHIRIFLFGTIVAYYISITSLFIFEIIHGGNRDIFLINPFGFIFVTILTTITILFNSLFVMVLFIGALAILGDNLRRPIIYYPSVGSLMFLLLKYLKAFTFHNMFGIAAPFGRVTYLEYCFAGIFAGLAYWYVAVRPLGDDY